MCIRDSGKVVYALFGTGVAASYDADGRRRWIRYLDHSQVCLLYTSDAADERSSVDLGGRRSLKKKIKSQLYCCQPQAYAQAG